MMNESPDPKTAPEQARIAANIRAEIHRAGYPTTRLPELLGLHRTTVASRLDGRTAFYAHEIVRLSDVLDVSPVLLLAVDDPKPAPPRGAGPGIIGPQWTDPSHKS